VKGVKVRTEPNHKPNDGRLAAVLCLIGATLGFGVIPIFLKHFADTPPHLDAWTVNGVRYSVGALFWLPFLLLLGSRPAQAGPNAPARNVWRDAVVPSIVNVIGQACFGLSAYYVKASTVGFVIRLSFLFTVLFGFLVLAEERLLMRKPIFWIGAAISVAGVLAMFYYEFQGDAEFTWAGAAIIVATAVAWGAYAVTVRRYMAAYPARQSFGVISIYSSLALVALMFALGKFERLLELTPGLWASLMISALIGIAFGHVLYYRGIHRLGPVVANGVTLLTPFVTYVTAIPALHEQLSVAELLGGLLVVGGGGLLVFARGQVEKDLAGPPERGPVPGE
jgi:drug/metabolite transporter (DMT)-like permease